MTLAQCCSGGKANFWVLLACVVSVWLVFSWIPSVWRAKGDVINKIIKIVVVVGLVVAVVLAVKQSRTVPSASPARGEQVLASPSGLPRLVDLGSGTCIPCKITAPILEGLKKDYAGRLEVVFIDLCNDPDTAKRYKIQVIPTQIFYDPSGQEIFRTRGFSPRRTSWPSGTNLVSVSPRHP